MKHELYILDIVSVKYIGIYTCFLCVLLLAGDFWRLLPRKDLSDRQLFADAASRLTLLTIIPALFYLGLFWLHFAILTKAGTHDSLMTSQFQCWRWRASFVAQAPAQTSPEGRPRCRC